MTTESEIEKLEAAVRQAKSELAALEREQGDLAKNATTVEALRRLRELPLQILEAQLKVLDAEEALLTAQKEWHGARWQELRKEVEQLQAEYKEAERKYHQAVARAQSANGDLHHCIIRLGGLKRKREQLIAEYGRVGVQVVWRD